MESNSKLQNTQNESTYSVKEFPLKEITDNIISSAVEVHKALGPGLLESVYDDALAYEFTLRNIIFDRQKEINL